MTAKALVAVYEEHVGPARAELHGCGEPRGPAVDYQHLCGHLLHGGERPDLVRDRGKPVRRLGGEPGPEVARHLLPLTHKR